MVYENYLAEIKIINNLSKMCLESGIHTLVSEPLKMVSHDFMDAFCINTVTKLHSIKIAHISVLSYYRKCWALH
jgi:hypothetical protein